MRYRVLGVYCALHLGYLLCLRFRGFSPPPPHVPVVDASDRHLRCGALRSVILTHATCQQHISNALCTIHIINIVGGAGGGCSKSIKKESNIIWMFK